MAAIEPSSSPSWASWEKGGGAGKEAKPTTALHGHNNYNDIMTTPTSLRLYTCTMYESYILQGSRGSLFLAGLGSNHWG